MKSKLKLFGIIALAAIIWFSMLACGAEDDDTIPLPTPKGWLTVNNISEHNGKYVYVGGGSSNVGLHGMQSIRGDIENPETIRIGLVPISGETVSIPLYFGLSLPYEAYDGNHDIDFVYVTISKTQTFTSDYNVSDIVDEKYISITKKFTNGNLTLSWTTPADWMDY